TLHSRQTSKSLLECNGSCGGQLGRSQTRSVLLQGCGRENIGFVRSHFLRRIAKRSLITSAKGGPPNSNLDCCCRLNPEEIALLALTRSLWENNRPFSGFKPPCQPDRPADPFAQKQGPRF